MKPKRTRIPSAFVLLLALFLPALTPGGPLAGCKDPAERAGDLCLKRRQLLDSLYRGYGGGTVAREIDDKTRELRRELNPRGRQVMEILGNLAGETDRQSFEEKCLQLGRGGRPHILTDKARRFFDLPATLKTCHELVNLERKVAVLNRQLDPAEQVTCE